MFPSVSLLFLIFSHRLLFVATSNLKLLLHLHCKTWYNPVSLPVPLTSPPGWKKNILTRASQSPEHLLVRPVSLSVQHNFTITSRSSIIASLKDNREFGSHRMSLKENISEISCGSRFSLCIEKIRTDHTVYATQLLVQTLVLSQLNNCNAFLIGLQVEPLQMM